MLALAAAAIFQAQAKPSVVVRLNKPMMSGVAVSKSGRIFLSFPRWDEVVGASLAEVANGKLTAYPNAAFNRFAKRAAATRLLNVQGISIDSQDRLWALDAGSVRIGSTMPDGPKLVCFDLTTNKLVRVYPLPQNVALPTSDLNDVRIDLTRGKSGFAIATDASPMGPNGFVIVDLDSGESWRRMQDHPSTKADLTVVPVIEGKRLVIRPAKGPETPVKVGLDGLALTKTTLYYSPLISRHLYSVDLDTLLNRDKTEAEVAAAVQNLGEKGISDGLATDSDGNLFVTDLESNTVKRRNPDGTYATVMRFAANYWVDSLCIQNRELFATGTEWHRRPVFNKGKDTRKRRYVVAKISL